MRIRVVCSICLCIFFLGSVATSADEDQKIVRAKIGIQVRSGNEVRRAAAHERIKEEDRLRVYLIPEPEAAYIYVIHANQNTVVQLNNKKEQHKILKGILLILPSTDKDEFYQIDGKHSLEYITVICSPIQLSEIEILLKSEDLSYKKWLEIEQKLIEKSHIDLRDQVSKPWLVAGAVRPADPFLKELQIFSGKSLVVRKYEFRVKK
jgi:hypothetical protein